MILGLEILREKEVSHDTPKWVSLVCRGVWMLWNG
jgi:hypothetical protein